MKIVLRLDANPYLRDLTVNKIDHEKDIDIHTMLHLYHTYWIQPIPGNDTGAAH